MSYCHYLIHHSPIRGLIKTVVLLGGVALAGWLFKNEDLAYYGGIIWSCMAIMMFLFLVTEVPEAKRRAGENWLTWLYLESISNTYEKGLTWEGIVNRRLAWEAKQRVEEVGPMTDEERSVWTTTTQLANVYLRENQTCWKPMHPTQAAETLHMVFEHDLFSDLKGKLISPEQMQNLPIPARPEEHHYDVLPRSVDISSIQRRP